MQSASRFIKSLRKLQFKYACQAIVDTPPLQMQPGNITILSMVQRQDLNMYLGAIKSLYLALGRGGVITVNDGSLSVRQIDMLRQQIPLLEIVPLESINVGRCPRGGTWERLALIHELSRSKYVIQVDADTLTLGSAKAVRDAVGQNISFGLGTSRGRAVVPIMGVSDWAKNIDSNDISIRAEREMWGLRGASDLKYLRGSSGFAGFARGSLSLDQLEDFSDQMRSLLGRGWDEWGSEQIASNFTIANTPNAIVLPYPDYSCYYPHSKKNYHNHEFVHFIGSHRHDNGLYAAEFRGLCRRLVAASSGQDRGIRTSPMKVPTIRG